MATSLFITGTDTGVGKTVLTAALLCAARDAGLSAAPMKPVQTGCAPADAHLRAPDLDFCLRVAGMQVDEPVYRDMAPYCFQPACSPHLAALQAGQEIDLQTIVSAFRRLSEGRDCVYVEGAGGILVPLDDATTMLDLAQALEVPVVVAARPGLGTLNHTLLSLHALRGASLAVAGVVIVEAAETTWGDIELDNRRTIESRGEVPVLGVLPYVAGVETAVDLPGKLLEAGQEILNQL